MGMEMYLQSNDCNASSNHFLRGVRMIRGYDKDGSWISGAITSMAPHWNYLYIGNERVGTKNINKYTKNKLYVGCNITAYFPKNDRYNANCIVLEEPMKKDIKDLIKEVEPIIGQELLNSLSPAEKDEIKELLIESLRNTVKIYGITATFEDTKKDMSDITKTIVEGAVALTIIVDGNTKQILKSHIKE